MTPSSAATLLCVATGSDSRATDCSLYSGENHRLVCFVISSLQGGIQFTAWSGIREQRHHSQAGVATPDHTLRTKNWPLVTPVPEVGRLDEFARAAAAAVARYIERYHAYFARHNVR